MSGQSLTEMRYDKIIDLGAERFAKLAPANIDFEAEKGFAIQLLETKPELMKAYRECPQSLLQAVTNVAAIGLSLNPAKAEAYLITRNIKVERNPDRWETRIVLEPSYRGFCNLATNTGSIMWLQAKAVHEKDTYENQGIDKEPLHKHASFRDRGGIIGYCCIAKTNKGDYLTTEMSIEEIFKVRDSSESFKKGYGPWKDWPEEQAKKTVVRRAFKMLPKTDQFRRIEQAVHISNENAEIELLKTAPAINSYTVSDKEKFDALITSSDGINMFLFTKTIDEGVFTSLYHSFEKGQKGKYQKIVDTLCQEGAAKLREFAEALGECCGRGDDIGAQELLGDLSEDATAYMLEHFADEETAAYVREIQKEAA